MRLFTRPHRVFDTHPRPGDNLVTLEVHDEDDLLERTHLLTYTFAKVIQGTMLRQIVEWNLKQGRIRFIVAGGPAVPSPRGTILATLVDFPGDPVQADVEPITEEQT